LKFFVDTAQLDEIERAASYGVLDGVTTNPSLMAKVGIKGKANIHKHYKAICKLVDDNVSAEVIATDFNAMMTEAMELAAIDKKIVVKAPMTPDGIRVIRALSKEGVRTNCTLVFSAGQALLAAKAGATFVSPFIGRLDDIASNGTLLIADIVDIYRNYNLTTQVLAASIRHPMHIIECARLGADVATCPLSVIEQLFKHPLTAAGLEQFLADYEKSQQE